MGGDKNQSKKSADKMRKPRKGDKNLGAKSQPKTQTSSVNAPVLRNEDSSKKTPTLRKMVDPETKQYFAEIANLFESNSIDAEDHSAVCGNALEETRGKEVELATDTIISHTLQRLIQGCDLDHLCAFLRGCSGGFTSIATDKGGSHVAESAIKALASHLQDGESYTIVEETLNKICRVVVVDAVDVMCSHYGSHVLRSLLCLCKGVPLESMDEFHATKPSAVLAERLNLKPTRPAGDKLMISQPGFPDVFSSLVREMLNHAKDEITTLRVNKYSSFVFQTVLRLLVGNEQELVEAIQILLRCNEKDTGKENIIDTSNKEDIMALLEDTASSHLLEVIIEVAPDIFYDELLNTVFKGSLYEISCHQCGNYVVQALISSARNKDQVELIWMEVGPKVKKLLELGKSGVIASILAACQRLLTCTYESSQSLAAAVGSESESSSSIVPHILFLESYLREKSSWKWPVGDKMHILGCLMLQTILKYPNHFVREYITSITSMEADQIYQTAKDSGGVRVLEAFLGSDVPAKQKFKVITKLKDHFGELSMHPSCSFTVEKCFAASNLSLKEAIAEELHAVQTELFKTKHGPYLLKKLDIDRFARNPQQWKSSLASKEAAYREFEAIFGSENIPHKQDAQVSPSSHEAIKKKHTGHQKTSDETERHRDSPKSVQTASQGVEFPGFENSMAKLGFPVHNPSSHEAIKKKHTGHKKTSDETKRHRDSPKSVQTASQGVEFPGFENSMAKLGFPVHNPGPKTWKSKIGSASKFVTNSTKAPFLRKPGKRKSHGDELADLAAKGNLNAGDVRKLFLSTTKSTGEQSGNDRTHFQKKQRK